ncbi:MrpF/PhaF family protein [Streptomyces sp. NRRL S-87]|uniref:MrpF/PhaF family protein n=1 Tax=Streptomyces sp. NRRL S-87 TaxID=1463920 RepID=UPI0006914C14|nr:MrpF/PhaF family protein [Streptomyces sp. NRRL S-87]
MNGWLLGAAALTALALPVAVWTACQGPPAGRLAGLAFAGTVVTAVLLLLTQAYGRDSYLDPALVLAVLGPVGVLVFARFLAVPEAGPARAASRTGGGSGPGRDKSDGSDGSSGSSGPDGAGRSDGADGSGGPARRSRGGGGRA